MLFFLNTGGSKTRFLPLRGLQPKTSCCGPWSTNLIQFYHGFLIVENSKCAGQVEAKLSSPSFVDLSKQRFCGNDHFLNGNNKFAKFHLEPKPWACCSITATNEAVQLLQRDCLGEYFGRRAPDVCLLTYAAKQRFFGITSMYMIGQAEEATLNL